MNGPPSSPHTTARYEAIAPIGTGGMATVFVGRARGAVGFSRLVALKRAHSHVKNDERLAASMKLEARLASRLHHKNVVSVLDVEEDDGDLVLILDYVEGCTLRSLSVKLEEHGEKRPREMLRIILDVAAGLHAAHQTTDEDGRRLGLVHRDVSPSNILVGVDGVARIADFGIAKAIIEGSERTETGVLKGKSSYMAPEYVMHQRASAQSDLFSLGVVTWESLACARLFKGPNDIETLKRVMRAEWRPLSQIDPELAPLDAVIQRALAREWSDRHVSVEDMARELEMVARQHDLVATHAEVSALVERIAQVELSERRQLLRLSEHDPNDDVQTVVASSRHLQVAAAGRDDLLTASAPAPSSLPASQRLSSTAAPITLPPTSSSRSDRSVLVTPQIRDPRHLGSSRAEALESKSRGREMLALAGAFVLLGIALSAMAIQLGTAPFDEAPPQELPNAAPTQQPPPPTLATSLATTDVQPVIATAADASVVLDASSVSTPSSSSSAPDRHRPKKVPPNPYPQGSSTR